MANQDLVYEFSNIDNNNPFHDKDIIHKLSVATTVFAYRRGLGLIKEMHCKGKLKDADMKRVNKFIVNRMAYIFSLILDDNYLEMIRSSCNNNKVEVKLAYASAELCIIDGLNRNNIKLSKNEINEIIIDMIGWLYSVFKMILSKDLITINLLTLSNVFYNTDWDYAVPENISLNKFLKKLKKYN